MSEQVKARNQCQVTKPDGLRCKATALPGLEFCVFHDPSRATERRAAKARGGRGNHKQTLAPGTPDIKIENSKDLLAFMNVTMNQVRTGMIDSRVASTLGYLADIMMRAIKQNHEDRIQKMEALAEGRMAALIGGRHDSLSE